jgi:polyvinyl alcohol dehydrogenase (cytochrome)
MRYVYLLALVATILAAQDGSSIYKERCAACHEAPPGRVPPISAIKAMSGEAIYTALTRGPMAPQAAGLSSAQLIALITYIAPTGGAHATAPNLNATCKSEAAFSTGKSIPQWDGWGNGVSNARFQDAASAKVTPTSVAQLKLKWAFNLGDVTEARSQPAVVGGSAFIGTGTGAVYSLDAESGCTHWGFLAANPIRSGVTVAVSNGTPTAFFADAAANVYALNAQSGALIWKIHPVDHFATIATATPRYYQGVVYQAFSSFEEALGGDPKYQCCTFRGSVAALDAATGQKLWQTFTISDTPKSTHKSLAGTQQFGPSGAGIWSTPTIDEKLHVLYVATGDNYSEPPGSTSDAILALDLKTGQILWSRQLTGDDTYNNACAIPIPGNCPQVHGADFDFGQPPILVSLASGTRLLVVAQKSGMVHAIDPDQKGKILWQTRVGDGGPLGGSQWGSASDGEKVYVAISDAKLSGVPDPTSARGFRLVLDPAKGGGLFALDLKTGSIVWSAKPTPCRASKTNCSPAQSAAVTAIPGVVFSGSVDGHLRAYASDTGKVLWDTSTVKEFETVNGKSAHGGSLDAAGPAVVDGMVFVNSGYGQWGGMPGNVFLAFSVK